MGTGEPALVPKAAIEHAAPAQVVPRHPVWADDIVVACSASIGVMALAGATLSLTHLLYLTAPFNRYLDLPLFLLIWGGGIAAGFRARPGGLARRLFAILTGSALTMPLIYRIGFGALVGWELAVGATALGGTILWAKRRRSVIQQLTGAVLDPGPLPVLGLPAPSNQAPAAAGTAASRPADAGGID